MINTQQNYEDEAFCDHCEKYTQHIFHDSGHERDSSGDLRECQVCKWYKYGLTDTYTPPSNESITEIKDDKTINHIRNIKLIQAVYSGKKFYVECYPTDKGALCFPNSNRAVKEIELPDFDLHEEKLGYRWVKI